MKPSQPTGKEIAGQMRGLPGLLVLIALLALVVIPMLVRGRVDRLSDQIDQLADPSGEMLGEIQFLLARQTSSLRGYLLTRDSSFLERYREMAAREAAIYPELEALAADLSPEISADVSELRTLSAQWHERIVPEQIAGADPSPERSFVALEQELYGRALDAAAAGIQSVRASEREREAEIARIERNARVIYAGLFLLSALAVFSVATLNARIRALAADAETRRAELEDAMKATERAMAARADLIRGFTHDVKNPLGVADGYAELLELGLRGELNPQQTAVVERIRGSIRTAVEIINELLDLSRLESGGLQLYRRPLKLPTLVKEVVQQHLNVATSAGIELRCSDAEKAHAEMVTFTDADRVRQILQNLISNALKYTPPPGTVIVAVDYLFDDPIRDGAWARVRVSDSGPGVPIEEQERIFDEFHRVPGTRGQGHGLGLAISRRIARLLGGDVTLDSVLGQGATFMLWLPLREEPETAAAAAD